jgi:hypothetical protein
MSTSDFEKLAGPKPSSKIDIGAPRAGFGARFYDRVTPADPAEWHHWYLFLPARDIDGHWIIKHVWRRRHDETWHYKPRDAEHDRLSGDW